MLTTSLTLNYLGVALPQSATPTNTITGTAPGQTLSGKKGVNNEIISDGGGSTLIGGGGSDTFVVEDPDDAVVVAAGSGVDTIDSDAAYYQLAANVQNLVLSYAGGVGVGNNLDNLLVAEGRIDVRSSPAPATMFSLATAAAARSIPAARRPLSYNRAMVTTSFRISSMASIRSG